MIRVSSRLLVDDRVIKYLTIESGTYSTEDMCFGPSLISLLPHFPSGDWNDALVARDVSDQPHFVRATRNPFPGVKDIWHGTYVDYLDIEIGEKLRTGVYETTCPIFNTVVVVKFARFDWEIGYIENETKAYQWIEGYDIGPDFWAI